MDKVEIAYNAEKSWPTAIVTSSECYGYCGSGSLLLQARKHFDAHIIEDGFFGQELNHTTYNLARMNMFLHNINYDKFNIQLGDTCSGQLILATSL